MSVCITVERKDNVIRSRGSTNQIVLPFALLCLCTTVTLTNFSDPRAPGVAAADYAIISHGRSLLKAPLLRSANEIAHEECGRPPVM